MAIVRVILAIIAAVVLISVTSFQIWLPIIVATVAVVASQLRRGSYWRRHFRRREASPDPNKIVYHFIIRVVAMWVVVFILAWLLAQALILPDDHDFCNPEDPYCLAISLVLLVVLLPFIIPFLIVVAYLAVTAGAVAASPLAALFTAYSARSRGLDVRTYTLVGTLLFVGGVMPWMYMMMRIFGKEVSRRGITWSYILIYVILISFPVGSFEFTYEYPVQIDRFASGIWTLPGRLGDIHIFVMQYGVYICVLGFLVSLVRVRQLKRRFVRYSERAPSIIKGHEETMPSFDHSAPFIFVGMWILAVLPAFIASQWRFIPTSVEINIALITFPLAALGTAFWILVTIYKIIRQAFSKREETVEADIRGGVSWMKQIQSHRLAEISPVCLISTPSRL